MGRGVGFAVLILAILASSVTASAHMKVVCTTTIIANVVSQIAGEEASVASLIPVNADPHAFEPTPRDAALLQEATVIFINGAGLEQFLAPLLQDVSARTVDLASGLELRHLGPNTSSEAASENARDVDPHVWFNPMNVITWTTEIADALAKADPAHADAYRKRADAYQATLRDLDQWIRTQVEAIPAAKRDLVTDHDAFGYFADRYGFDVIGAVFPGLSTLSEPSAKQIATLESAIARVHAPAIFVGTTVNPALAEQIASDTGIRTVFLYTGSLSGPDGPASTYVDFMRYDVEQIVKGLTDHS
jgi:ABC-type Zn uptake system ZnuABC Zn-binding protein ZnuA